MTHAAQPLGRRRRTWQKQGWEQLTQTMPTSSASATREHRCGSSEMTAAASPYGLSFAISIACASDLKHQIQDEAELCRGAIGELHAVQPPSAIGELQFTNAAILGMKAMFPSSMFMCSIYLLRSLLECTRRHMLALRACLG